jgi:hypothetical protein
MLKPTSILDRLKSLLACATLACVAACGGGGGAGDGTPPFGGPQPPGGGGGGGSSTPTAASLVLVLSAPTIASDGTEEVVATATALDANRNTVVGVPVAMAVNADAFIALSGNVTGENGSLEGNVNIGANRTPRTITVTAVAAGLTPVSATLEVVGSSGTGTQPSDLILTLSSASIANNGSQSVTATAIALDARRNTMVGVPVTFTVDNSGTASPAGTITGANGSLAAGIGIGGNSTNRTILVTATSGALTRTVPLTVTDAPVVGPPTAADLSLALSASTLPNGGTSTITAVATAVDANRNALAGIPVTFTVDSSAVAIPGGTVTAANGTVAATVGIGADRSNRVITVTATSGALTRSQSFSVIGATLRSALALQVDTNSAGNQVEYTLVDTNGTPMAGLPVSISAPGLPSAAPVTDFNGKVTYTYTAPATAGTLLLSASAAGDTQDDTVTVRTPGVGSVPDATQAPLSASITPTPSVVSVNQAGSTANQVELRALFLGTGNVPIQNIRVRFDLADNSAGSDATVSWLGGTYAFSDANGVARGTLIPGVRSSPTNGITVRACWSQTDFAVGTCPNAITNTITITSEALSVNIRTNELIKEGAARLTYVKEFVVMVVDSAGVAKQDVLITPSVDLAGYWKGEYQFVVAEQLWLQFISAGQCLNEDDNRNGVLEAGEDFNGNGELDPRKSDVAVKMVGSSRTDANGIAIVQIEYGRSVATWVDFEITVTASGVSGTESRAKYKGFRGGLGNLPAPGSALTDRTVAPAFVVSPYGRASSCADPN